MSLFRVLVHFRLRTRILNKLYNYPKRGTPVNHVKLPLNCVILLPLILLNFVP